MKTMKKLNCFLIYLLATTLTFTSCSDDDDNQIDCMDFVWAYDGDATPDTWSTCFSECAGQSQSPIAITGEPADQEMTAMITDYAATPIQLTNNGRNIELTYQAGSTIKFNNVDYELQQFHFHTASEHTVNGTQFPMETHLVHQNSSGELLVLSVVYEEGNENAFLKNFSDNLPNTGEVFNSPDEVNVTDLIPTTGGYFTYSGSLTTPPCSEGVIWLVMKETVKASSEQLDNFTNILQNNFRPTQALNGRVISDFDCGDFVWAYDGDATPDTWHTCFADCGGQVQSPIDITGAVVNNGLSAIDAGYNDAPVDLINNGRTILFNYTPGGELRLDAGNFELLQFHFHAGSEHTVDGVRFPLEAHMVHQDEATGNLAVISILFREGSENAFLANFSDDLPAEADDTYTSTDMINVGNLLQDNAAYFTYGGSLTTPPCSETVTWMVLKEPIEASATQIANMQNILQDNYRPTQALNGRTISEFN